MFFYLCIAHFIFILIICRLASPLLTLGQPQRGQPYSPGDVYRSLFFVIRPQGHRELSNRVDSRAQSIARWVLNPATFQFFHNYFNH